MSSGRPCIVGLGELVWDHLPGASLPGGAPANFAFHVSQLNAEAHVVSAVGSDDAGDRLIAWLNRIGLSADYVQRNALETGLVEVTFDCSGQPQYVIRKKVAWDHLEWTAALGALARRADCVCVGSLSQRSATSRGTIQRFLADARSDCLKVFDVNIRQPHCTAEVIHETLQYADVLKLNDEEWPLLAGMLNLNTDPTLGLLELLAKGRLRVIAMTCGSKGSLIVDTNGIHRMAADPISVLDTIGAGDAFTAALAIGVLRHDPVQHIQLGAAAVASFVCTQSGATPLLPRRLIRQVVRRSTLLRKRESGFHPIAG
ncbi:MAG: iolC [Phycisphaerales bacterium]|nr:iolC [Phycisphaerales bacterium]